MWILYICLYGFLIGFFNVYKKQATKDSSVLSVLTIYTVTGFLLISWKAAEAFTLSYEYILLILLKSAIIVTSWNLELNAIKDYYISILQPLSAIRVVIAFCASILIFSEPSSWMQFVGILIVGIGIALLNNDKNKNLFISRKVGYKKLNKVVIFFLISCILSETSAIFDKFALQNITQNQMQWWFMFFDSIFLILITVVVSLIKKKPVITKSDFKNIYAYAVGLILIVADNLLFTGLMDPASKASIVAVLKQIALVVTVLFGGLMFKEPNLKERLYVLAIILCGIIIILI